MNKPKAESVTRKICYIGVKRFLKWRFYRYLFLFESLNTAKWPYGRSTRFFYSLWRSLLSRRRLKKHRPIWYLTCLNCLKITIWNTQHKHISSTASGKLRYFLNTPGNNTKKSSNKGLHNQKWALSGKSQSTQTIQWTNQNQEQYIHTTWRAGKRPHASESRLILFRVLIGWKSGASF